MRVRLFAIAAVGSLTAYPFIAQAQQPWIDAGQQAMIQHYNELIEQQSAPGQEEAAEKARRDRGAENALKNERCDTEAVKAKLRPEYERRARADGAQAANAWLRGQAEEAGSYAAQNC